MLALTAFLALFAVFQIANSQGIDLPIVPIDSALPKECLQPIHVDPRKCCEIPPFFSKEDFESCGFDNENEKREARGPENILTDGGVNNLWAVRCSQQICLLNIYNLVEDNKVDEEAFSGFIDSWTDMNPDFKPGAVTAKAKCLGRELPRSREICEPNEIVSCIRSTLFKECPKWKTDTEDCQRLKSYVVTCSKYF